MISHQEVIVIFIVASCILKPKDIKKIITLIKKGQKYINKNFLKKDILRQRVKTLNFDIYDEK
jgi:hypothetical protein